MITAHGPLLRASVVLLICFTWSGHAFAAVPDDANRRYYDGSPTGPVLNLESLEPILEEFDSAEPESLSMWDRLKIWMDQFFESDRDGSIPDWIRDFRISESAAEWVFYISCLLIVGLSVAIVVNEVRHAGSFRKRLQPPRGRVGEGRPAAAPSLDDLTNLPLTDQPAALLRAIISHLSISGIAGNRRELPGSVRQLSLTHRQIVAAARDLEGEQSAPLVRIARIAEQIRYGGWLPGAVEINPVLADGRVFLAQLEQRDRKLER